MEKSYKEEMEMEMQPGEEQRPYSAAPEYKITNFGRVLSLKSKKQLKGSIRGNGYLSVRLYFGGKSPQIPIHKLVATTFLDAPDVEDLVVNHKDGNKLNNRVDNLELVTQSANAKHSVDILGKVMKTTRGVDQLTMDGELIATFKSLKEAEVKTGASFKQIYKVCTGSRISTHKFKWRYTEEIIKDEEPEGKVHPKYPSYIITEDGMVYSKLTNKYLANKHREDYPAVTLAGIGGTKADAKTRYIHVLVADIYCEKPENTECKLQVDHIDRNHFNNHYTNLRWVTASENGKAC